MSDEFYTSIASYYQHIFPFNLAQIEFLKHLIPFNGAKILDVGCATGELAFALTQFGFPVWAFDFDSRMIEIAMKTKQEDTLFPVFEQLDMLKIGEHFPESFFNTVVCFGNTLVHLLNADDIRSFLKSAHKVLSSEGKLALQILNYQHILDHRIQKLALIDNTQIKFERQYNFSEDSELIDFRTKLTVNATGQKIENSVKLYPIRLNKLQALLIDTGFNDFEVFGSFKREPLNESSLTLVISCTKV